MSTKQALIVDDSSTAQYRLKKMLKGFNLDVAIVDSGEEALRYLSHTTPDVVFMDHLMPGMDGFKALQIIKSHPETATVPVIMYTSKSGDLYTGQARALGALDVVSKDTINAADLGNVLEKLHVEKRPSNTASKIASPPADTDIDSSLTEVSVGGEAMSSSSSDTVVKFNRRSSDSRQQAETRNVELRISHLEHSIEENRRFITARVVRELQNLRHKMKRELAEVVEKSTEDASQKKTQIEKTDAALEQLVDSQKHDQRPTFILIAVVLLAILCTVFYLQIQSSLTSLYNTQNQMTDQVDELVLFGAPVNEAEEKSSAEAATAESQAYYAQEDYLNDLTWAFNQSGEYRFNIDQFDADSLIRLNEFFARVNRNGFQGLAIVKINLGNFCINLSEFGQPAIAGANISSAKCMLLSETYNLETIVDQYAENIQSSLAVFYGADNQNELSLQAGGGESPYPERAEGTSAATWNEAAVKNTFIEVELVPDLI